MNGLRKRILDAKAKAVEGNNSMDLACIRMESDEIMLKLLDEIDTLKDARDKSAKAICEDCGAALARF